MTHPFESFLATFIPQVAAKSRQLNKVCWILETTGCKDAADLSSEFNTELRLLFNDKKTYDLLLDWSKNDSSLSLQLKRELDILIRGFKQNMIPKDLLREISAKESELAFSYANFRPSIEGTLVSDNEIREILKNEKEPKKRELAWEASKEIGDVLAPQILQLVN